MLDLDKFVVDCRHAIATDPSCHHLREVVLRAVADRSGVINALGEPRRGQLQTLYRSPELTVLNVIWAPSMTIMPHDHRMWAVIGLYGGREDNVFWQRVPGHPDGKVEISSVKTLETGQSAVLDRDVIHSVTNPTRQLSGAIHVYGGDFFATERSEWDPDSLVERPFDADRAVRLFEEANLERTG
jgi:predicted metal-dependent enzyme (double-stranded beta helix superfamily)